MATTTTAATLVQIDYPVLMAEAPKTEGEGQSTSLAGVETSAEETVTPTQTPVTGEEPTEENMAPLDEHPRGHIVSLGSDRFLLNGQVLNFGQLIMYLELQRADNLEKQLEGELQSMAQLNELLKTANEMLALARAEKGAIEGKEASVMPPEMIEFFMEHDIQQGISSWDKENKGEDHGLTLGNNGYDFRHNKDEWEQSIENLKSFIDGLNSRSQLEMIQLSALMKKRDESLNLPSNTNKAIHDTNMANIRNV